MRSASSTLAHAEPPAPVSSTVSLATRLAELPQVRVRVDAGAVAVGPDGVEPVGADQGDVGQLVLAGPQVGLGGEAARVASLAAAGGTRAGAAQDVERDAVGGAVGPLDQQGAGGLVVVEAHRAEVL